jgi:hypothetical protein
MSLFDFVQLLGQLHKVLPYAVGFLSTFLGSAEICFLLSVLVILTAISCIVHIVHAPMLLAEVAMLLSASVLGNSGCRFSTRLLLAILALGGSFLGLCTGLLLGIYMLNSFKRRKKQMHVQQHHAFLVQIALVLPLKWTHSKHVTPQFSLHERNIHGNRSGIGTWAVVEAWHLCNVGIELLYTTYKLTHADMLGLLEHVGEVSLSCSAALMGNTVRRWDIMQPSNDWCDIPLVPICETP